MATKNVFRGTIIVEREFDAGSPQSLLDAMASFATIKKAAEDAKFAVEVKSSTAKKREPGEAS